MLSIHSLIVAVMLTFAGTALAGLDFDTDATLHDYPSMGNGVGANNPPWCEMGYDSLDLNSVTAYCAIDKSTCGTCLQICGSVGCKYMLAIDQCSRGDGLLDISTGAGMEIGGDITGHMKVTAKQVDATKCEHIWNGKMYFSWQAPYGGLATLASLINGGHANPTTSVEVTKTPEFTPTTSLTISSSTIVSISESKPTASYTAIPSIPDPTVVLPTYSAPDTETFSVVESFTPVATPNGPWSVPSAPTHNFAPPFSNSTASKTSPTRSTPVVLPTEPASSFEMPPGTAKGDAPSHTTGVCKGATTVTVTVPGSMVYVTVTASNGDDDSGSNTGIRFPTPSVDGVLAESTANHSTSSLTTTIRSTTTRWTTTTITMAESPQTSVVTTPIIPVTTVTASAAPSIYYPPGHWNITQQASGTHRPIDIPSAAAASAGAYAVEVKAREEMAAPIPHAKRSAASASAESYRWEAMLALSGLTALLFFAL